MGDSVVRWIALVGIVGVAVLFATELRRWRVIGSVIGHRHRVLRVCLIVLIELLFAMVFVGPGVIGRRGPLAEVAYWLICTIMGMAVVVLALIDLWAVARGYQALNRELFSDLKRDDRRKK